MRFTGTLTTWNDERGFGRIESDQGGEPIFVHVSAFTRGRSRPQLNQVLTFEIEVGPKGKRAKNVEVAQAPRPARRGAPRRAPPKPTPWGTATLFALPAFLALVVVLSAVWKLPAWVAGLYGVLSLLTFITYAWDKAAAARGAWRTSEGTLHALALVGGWPGALLAQQLLRHKSSKRSFRAVFWATVLLNVAGLLVLATPLLQALLPMLGGPA